MSVLWRGLPEDALSKQTNSEFPTWGMQEELLAQLIEEVSVFAADRRRKEPRILPRPWDAPKATTAPEGVVATPEGGRTGHGLSGMLAMTNRIIEIGSDADG